MYSILSDECCASEIGNKLFLLHYTLPYLFFMWVAMQHYNWYSSPMCLIWENCAVFILRQCKPWTCDRFWPAKAFTITSRERDMEGMREWRASKAEEMKTGSAEPHEYELPITTKTRGTAVVNIKHWQPAAALWDSKPPRVPSTIGWHKLLVVYWVLTHFYPSSYFLHQSTVTVFTLFMPFPYRLTFSFFLFLIFV